MNENYYTADQAHAEKWLEAHGLKAVAKAAVVLNLAEAPFGNGPSMTVAELLRMNGGGSRTIKWVADQIEQQTRPPKPEEPTGLGAVVEDSEGRQWLRSHGVAGCVWHDGTPNAARTAYSRINAVRVLSEGVTA